MSKNISRWHSYRCTTHSHSLVIALVPNSIGWLDARHYSTGRKRKNITSKLRK